MAPRATPSRASSRRLFLPLFAVAVTGLAAFTTVRDCRRPAIPEPEATRLAEFAGSYPDEVPTGPTLRSFEIEAAPARMPLLDGTPLDVWAYNGRVPGPTLRLRRGERLRVGFTNRLPQPSTIHWHGVRVPNAMDGTPWVSQPPVEPGGRFVYEFTPKDAGTFWFHPHLRSSEQVERGLYGVLIVDDDPPLPWSQDVVWVLDDWRLDGHGAIDPQFNTFHDLMHDGRWGGVVTVNGRRREQLHVRPGERIRLRLLDSANGRVFAPDFGPLDAKVIAVDGLYTARPLDPTGFVLAPGNRLDLDITIPPALRATTVRVVDRFLGAPAPLAEIVVGDEAVATPGFASPAQAHVPAWGDARSSPVQHEFRLDSRRGGELGIQWMINERPFAGHAAMHASHDGDYPLQRGRFTHLRFENRSYRLHPMHIHGVFFKLLARNGLPADEPFFRDTVLLRPRDTVDIGLVPLDEGRWMMHCHILEHAESGMMTLLDVRR